MKKAFPYIVLAILAVLVLVIKTCKTPSPKIKKNDDANKNEAVKERGLTAIHHILIIVSMHVAEWIAEK